MKPYATSVSSGSDSARSWNVLEHGDGSTATGSLGSRGPGSSDDNRNTRRRLDTFSSRGGTCAKCSVHPRFPCEQYHTGITIWINNLWENPTCQHTINPSEFIAKQVLWSARLVFETRAKCQDFVARYRVGGFPHEIDSPCCSAKTAFSVRQSNSLEDREIGKQFAPLWECWPNSSKFSSLKVMAQVHLLSLRSTPAHKFSESRIEETALENQCSNLSLLEADRSFALVAPDLCVLGVPGEVCLQRPMCDGPPLRLTAFPPPGGSRRDREYFSANQLKKKCKKKFFHGIHDRFIRDEQFCNRMIENGSRRRCLSTNGCSCGRRSYSPFDPTIIFLLRK